MGKSSCCSKEGLRKGAWTDWEDKILASYINVHGEGKWRNLPKRAGLKRCCRSCRLRWVNYLRPDIKRGNISHDEEELIIRLHNLLGNRWSLIAGRLPGRTDNEIKNYWNTTLAKRAKAQASIEAKTIPTKSRLNEPSKSSTKIEVIRTKAIRCSSKVMVPLQPPATHQHGQHHYSNNNEEMGGDIATIEAHNGIQMLESLYSDGGCDLLSFEINELLKSHDGGEFEENPMQEHFPLGEAMFKGWSTSHCLDDNGATDLAFLLDADEWP
ncbi:hypothetical protein J1N35_003176 [Gossypium stocksii]|uniref:Myb-related protein 123 n=1 Tax=Gossypium stocksii TaxID=47602 RepID=A0A9D3WNP7_9ROSI|nr:hypothetical protein J1N35_003176 [Gossypium stocksii]